VAAQGDVHRCVAGAMLKPTRRLSSPRHLAVCVALPAIASLAFLLVVSLFVYGHAVRPGLYAETLLVLYASLLLLQFQRNKTRGAIFNTLLLLTFYSACLAKYLVLREAVSWSDFDAIGALFVVLPMWQRFALALAGGFLGVLLFTNLTRPRLLPTLLLLLPLFAYVIGSLVAPARVYALLEAVRPTSVIIELEAWRDGPLIVTARQWPRVRTMRRFLTQPPRAAPDAEAVAARARILASLPPPRRSLHIILLEGFVDPLNFRLLPCPSDPIDARLRRWMTEGQSLALSATFGGKSARAEFEVLCGVPSYEELGVDFMALRGAAVQCLPNLLRQRGYVTMASHTAMPSFFNHEVAYAALGFEQAHFAPDFVMTEADMDGELLSDAALYAQTLQWVLPPLQEGRPLLNYVETFVGHHPFELNPQRHPPVCGDGTLAGKVANVAHYSSIAVADYVELIESYDPGALIVVLADHLPPLGVAGSGYREAEYRLRFHGREAPPFWDAQSPSWLESRATMLVVRQARQPVSLGLIPHYLIPEALLDLLTDGAYCRATTCLASPQIINRPHGTRPVFTTPEIFPSSVCAVAAGSGDPLCRTGADLQRRLHAEYDALLRTGLQDAPITQR
jgi:hypothetical protein